MKINTFSHDSAEFPNSLHDLHDPPSHLYWAGLPLPTKTLGVIGSRRMTRYGREAMQLLLPPLIRKDVAIISGLALGVDGYAHRLALQGGGYTAAVLPSGLPEVYPRSHQSLAQNIIDSGGALISEYEAPHSVRKHDFLRRNRLVAALSDVLLVVEATERSGTTSTVRHALELGKPVLAVPGSIITATSAGTNRLIRAGAAPALSWEDIAMELAIDVTAETITPIASNAEEQAIIDLLAGGACDINHLARRLSFDVQTLQRHLTELELSGAVRPLGAQRYSLRQ